MQSKVIPFVVRIMIKMIDTIGIKKRGAATNTVNLVTFAKQEFCQIGTILACNACN